jgi:hypothetical protein
MSEASSDTCPGCKELTIPGKAFCANCGAPLNNDSFRIRALIDEALESRFKDRDYVTMETSVDVASKLTDWFKLFLYWAAIPLGVLAIILSVLGFFFGVFGFHSYSDFTAKVADATGQVQNASDAAIAKDRDVLAKLGTLESHIQSADTQVSRLHASSEQIAQKYARLQSDYGRYDQIDQKIGALQSQLTTVQGQVVDMGHRKLIAGSFETTGTDENGKEWDSSVMLGRPGCGPSSLNERHSVALCVLNSPLRPFVFLS